MLVGLAFLQFFVPVVLTRSISSRIGDMLLFLRITNTVCFSSRRKMENELCNLHETLRIIEEDIQTTRQEL